MIRHLTCIEVTCEDCEYDCWEDGTPHFQSLDEAREYAGDGWLITDTEQVCNRCVAARACKAEGHIWGEWRQWPRDALSVVRFCDRCNESDYTVAVHAGGTR